MEQKKVVVTDNERLSKQLTFTAEIDKMTGIFRRTMLLDKSRRENDAEHSWHIGVMAILFKEYALGEPDIGHVVKMCLCHDLVEVYAGDTFAYDIAANVGKQEREEQAADKLFAQLPDEQGAEIRALWDEFDAMETVDSKYANCLDRIQPFLHNTLTEGHTWCEGGAKRWQVEKRMGIVKEFMPKVYEWVDYEINEAMKKGWITE